MNQFQTLFIQCVEAHSFPCTYLTASVALTIEALCTGAGSNYQVVNSSLIGLAVGDIHLKRECQNAIRDDSTGDFQFNRMFLVIVVSESQIFEVARLCAMGHNDATLIFSVHIRSKGIYVKGTQIDDDVIYYHIKAIVSGLPTINFVKVEPNRNKRWIRDRYRYGWYLLQSLQDHETGECSWFIVAKIR